MGGIRVFSKISPQITNPRCAKILEQTFFASSTDHTTLLSDAKVHRILENENSVAGPRKYLLLPSEIATDLAIKVDELHLARLYANHNIIFGAKVVQKTLGSAVNVCKPLLEMALDDITKFTNDDHTKPQAFASLTGLSQWVSNYIDLIEGDVDNWKDKDLDNNIQEILANSKHNNDGIEYEAIKAIATGTPRPGHSVVGQGTYRDGKEAWMKLSEEYVNMILSSSFSSNGNENEKEEIELYSGNGGTFSIEFLGDTSQDALKYSGGSLVKFEF